MAQLVSQYTAVAEVLRETSRFVHPYNSGMVWIWNLKLTSNRSRQMITISNSLTLVMRLLYFLQTKHWFLMMHKKTTWPFKPQWSRKLIGKNFNFNFNTTLEEGKGEKWPVSLIISGQQSECGFQTVSLTHMQKAPLGF